MTNYTSTSTQKWRQHSSFSLLAFAWPQQSLLRKSAPSWPTSKPCVPNPLVVTSAPSSSPKLTRSLPCLKPNNKSSMLLNNYVLNWITFSLELQLHAMLWLKPTCPKSSMDWSTTNYLLLLSVELWLCALEPIQFLSKIENLKSCTSVDNYN